MVGTGSSDRRRPVSALIWLISPLVLAVCTGTAVAVVTPEARVPVGWCGSSATVAVALAASEAARRGRVITGLRRRCAEQETALRYRLDEHEAETLRLARELLPRAVRLLKRGEPTEVILRHTLPTHDLEPGYAAAHRSVLKSVIEAVQAEESMRDSAQRAFVNIARRVQAIVHQQAYDIREMEHKHGNDPDVFGDLLHLDHGNALTGRLADSIAVLGGSRPGRQWKNEIPLYNVLRGAMSRILEYRRVDLHSVADVAVVGPAVEPVIHALAELLDNATRYSPPQTRVHLTAVDIQSGIAVEIEDAGVGLTDEARRRTDRVLSKESELDLDDLGEAPRLGLAVVARLARSYNFLVSLRPSAYGGVRAVLVIPMDLITASKHPGGDIARAPKLPPFKSKRRPGQRIPAPGPETPPPMMEHPIPPPLGDSGLPQRRRRRGPAPLPFGRAAAAQREREREQAMRTRPSVPVQPGPERDLPEQPPKQPGMWLAAFTRGINGELPEPDRDRPNSDLSSDKEE
ncbi:ATP-binding protein [Streptomyces albireticuli]|uniref:histidine kinase n=1 Tax=Streptomyces albireticuli TaxID=1940 RepID=A0A2A2D8C3_9ACTN|nr:ATP-binding protein [Streptomyces albireticuli]MCD9145350.1 sensor histidine kinase [Streptomyces albireticuli]MCD9166029.1 sensor histidine kinase [Streptomyces albireticuli]MCD9196304.1 sensor histidine kinase [Streptomyces albireticuli]PAU47590.1 ATP-binding protein [Streptomyces albireticuli]